MLERSGTVASMKQKRSTQGPGRKMRRFTQP
jgi:hypothetical protein